MSSHTLPLQGLAILLVEDEPLIALDISMALEDAGATVTGPCRNAKDALSVLAETSNNRLIKAAVLDVDLGKETSIPIARELQAQGIPFVFYTGMDQEKPDILKEFNAPIIPNPSPSVSLILAVAGIIDADVL